MKTKTQTENKLVREAQKCWEIYHGKAEDIPAMPPAFMRGFLDGAHAANARLQTAELVAFDCGNKAITLQFAEMPTATIGETWRVRKEDGE